MMIWDQGEGAVKGLHYRPDRKSFYLFYRTFDGTQRRPKIGDMPLEAAREVAKTLWRGIEIAEDPSLKRQQARAMPTVTQVYEMALEKHWSKPNFIKSGWNKQVQLIWKNHLKGTFGSLKIDKVTSPMIADWHSKFTERPIAGNRALSTLSKIMGFAELKGFRLPQSNPCKSVPHHPERSRRRFATDDELRGIAAFIVREREEYPVEAAFIETLLLTGARPSSLERASIDQLSVVEKDGKRVGLLVFEGKTGIETVVFPPQAMAVIDQLPKRADKKIFGIKMPRHFWSRIREEVGCPDLWARDLRRTFATVGLSNGENLDQIGRVLNHRSQNTTLTYAKLQEPAHVGVACSVADRMSAITQN